MITKKDLYDISKVSKPVKTIPVAKNYLLNERGLKVIPEGWGFVPFIEVDEQKIQMAISIPIKDISDNIMGYEFRSISIMSSMRYTKVFHPLLMPIYNIRNKRFNPKVVITEGILNCETLYQFSKLNVISSMRAKTPKYSLHYLCFLYSEITIVFDNDEPGINGAKEIKSFINKYYRGLVKVNIVYLKKFTKLNDLNELKIKEPANFKKLVRYLEQEYL